MSSSPTGAEQRSFPGVPPTFHWTVESWGGGLRCQPLEQIARHVFTTRQLQLTDSQDVGRLGTALGVGRVVMVTQVHRADVLVVRQANGAIESRPEADVIVSDDPGAAIAVRAADCVPVLIADRVTGTVAAVHAGWRGTAAGAAPVAVKALAKEFGARPENLVAAVGPSIGPCCYEVGTELVDAFAAAGHQRYLIDRWFQSVPPPRGSRERRPLHLDVAGANRDQLVLAGVPEASIHLSGLCTAMNLEILPSFRAEKVQAGRIAAAIVARGL